MAYSVLFGQRYMSEREARTVYRELARKCHPDLNPGIGQERIKELNRWFEKFNGNGKGHRTEPPASFTQAKHSHAATCTIQDIDLLYAAGDVEGLKEVIRSAYHLPDRIRMRAARRLGEHCRAKDDYAPLRHLARTLLKSREVLMEIIRYTPEGARYLNMIHQIT